MYTLITDSGRVLPALFHRTDPNSVVYVGYKLSQAKPKIFAPDLQTEGASSVLSFAASKFPPFRLSVARWIHVAGHGCGQVIRSIVVRIA